MLLTHKLKCQSQLLIALHYFHGLTPMTDVYSLVRQQMIVHGIGPYCTYKDRKRNRIRINAHTLVGSVYKVWFISAQAPTGLVRKLPLTLLCCWLKIQTSFLTVCGAGASTLAVDCVADNLLAFFRRCCLSVE